MSEQEQSRLNYLIKKFDEHSDHVEKELSEIKRGVYGDPPNKVPGLMDRQAKDEERISALEKIKDKLVWVTIGVGLAAQVVIYYVVEFFRK